MVVTHANFVKEMPDIEGYVQNTFIDRSIEKGRSAAYEDVPFDGLVELWFEDKVALLNSFASPSGGK